VPLIRAPLVRVLAQIRFVDVLKINDDKFIANFQERLREEYPDTKREQTSSIVIGPTGPEKIERGQVWRFEDLDTNWRVSLEQNFVALETTKYESRSDFMKRLEIVLAAVSECFDPTLARRVGIRYVDRIEEPEFSRMSELVRPEMLGIVQPNVHEHVEHTMSSATFAAPEGRLGARWGMLPAGQTHDPAIMAPGTGKSWVLDIDAFRELSKERLKFDVENLIDVTGGLAGRAYTFFRWSVTDKFLEAYGG